MLRNLMSFNASAQLNQVFFGGLFASIGGDAHVAGSVGIFDPYFPGARTGTFALGLCGGSGGASYTYCVQIFDEQPTWTVGFAFNAVVSGFAGHLCWVSENPDTQNIQQGIQFGVGVNADGSIYAVYNNNTQTTSAAGLWNVGTWYYIEMQATIGASETITIRLNGVVILTVTGVNTNYVGTGTAKCVALTCLPAYFTGHSAVYFADVYILDGQTGTGAPNNDFLGPVHVPVAFPNAPGYYSEFTPLANANWQEVSNYNFSDSAYNYTAVAGNIDTYGFTAFPAGIILGVQENVVCRKDYAGSRTLAPFYRGQGTDFAQTGAQLSLSNSYITVQAEFDGDPATGEMWTTNGLNAGQFGQEMIS
jgi:hypothetical protein